MLASLVVSAAFLTSSQNSGEIQRLAYGVPSVIAPNNRAAFVQMGEAVAEDRLWQMEMSRRSAKGRLAEVMGATAVASDKETLSRAYTESELMGMFSKLPTEIRGYFEAYSEGVNNTIRARKANQTLPSQYASMGFEPEPWKVTDSCAIAIMMIRQFGAGGAGELRNYALYQYLNGRVKERSLDVFDDLAWWNDKDSIPTVDPKDDLVTKPRFVQPTRNDTIKHIADLPKTSLLELAGAIRVANYEENRALAEQLSVPHKMGSYAILVSGKRSKSGNAMLLTAPQMGHRVPSIVHEISISVPGGIQVAGMNVPGMPGVIIGNSPWAGWGLTSGVADIEDVFVAPLSEDGNSYTSMGEVKPLESVEFELKIKDRPSEKVIQKRTVHGPVLLASRGSKAVYSLKSSYYMRELSSVAGMFDFYSMKSARELDSVMRKLNVSFNLFVAWKDGNTSYRYAGLVPMRKEGIDYRLPTPDTLENQWQGFVSTPQMPQVNSPSSGLLANWNNKPTAWWPNFDTPVWGRLFRNQALLESIPSGLLSQRDLERAAWAIARRETDTVSAFAVDFADSARKNGGELFGRGHLYLGFDGWNLEGSASAEVYDRTIDELRTQLFLQSLGNFLNPSTFQTVLQPSLIRKALDGQTKFDYLGGRKKESVILAAQKVSLETMKKELGDDISLWGYRPGSLPVAAGSRIPYSNRGTYIQITEMTPEGPIARNVLSPGISELGEHANDQADLARDWRFKTMPRVREN